MPPDQEPQRRDAKSASPSAKPLPKGYFWRLAVIVTLLLGASYCFIFANALIGSALMLAGLAFGKFSGLNDMVDADRTDGLKRHGRG